MEYVKTKSTAYLRLAILSEDKDASKESGITLKAYGPFNESPAIEWVNQKFFDQLIERKTKKEGEENESESPDSLHEGFKFDTEHRGGWYKYCLDNTHSSWAAKIVDFTVSHGLTNEEEIPEENVQESKDKIERRRRLVRSLDKMKARLRLIRNEQRYYSMREKRHMETLESSHSRLFWFTALDIVALGILYGVQIHTVQHWFAGRSDLGRQWA